jgi:hypothetical protein
LFTLDLDVIAAEYSVIMAVSEFDGARISVVVSRAGERFMS